MIEIENKEYKFRDYYSCVIPIHEIESFIYFLKCVNIYSQFFVQVPISDFINILFGSKTNAYLNIIEGAYYNTLNNYYQWSIINDLNKLRLLMLYGHIKRDFMAFELNDKLHINEIVYSAFNSINDRFTKEKDYIPIKERIILRYYIQKIHDLIYKQ